MLLSRLVQTACFTTTVAGYTHFSEEPGSCEVVGDGDLYGPGLRYGFYLQFGATALAWLVDLEDQLQSLKYATLILLIAVLANNVPDRTRPDSLSDYELEFLLPFLFLPLIILLTTFFLSIPKRLTQATSKGDAKDGTRCEQFWANPSSENEVDRHGREQDNQKSKQQHQNEPTDFSIVDPLNLLIFLSLAIYINVSRKGHFAGRKGPCPLWTQKAFLSEALEDYYDPDVVNDRTTDVVRIVTLVLATPCATIALLVLVISMLGRLGVINTETKRRHRVMRVLVMVATGELPDEDTKEALSLLLCSNKNINRVMYKWALPLIPFTGGTLLIVNEERLIKILKVNLDNSPFLSTGQFIPLVTGGIRLISTAWAAIVKGVWIIRNRRRKQGHQAAFSRTEPLIQARPKPESQAVEAPEQRSMEVV